MKDGRSTGDKFYQKHGCLSGWGGRRALKLRTFKTVYEPGVAFKWVTGRGWLGVVIEKSTN